MADATTLNELFFGSIEDFGHRPVAMRVKRGGAWVDLSYQDLLRQVRAVSMGLGELGVRPGDRVGLLSENRPEWAIADYACLTARCADVPVYPTLPARQIEYILRDSGAVAIFVSSAAQLEKVLAIRSQLPQLRHIIAFDPSLTDEDVVSLDALMTRGREVENGRVAAWRASALTATAADLATLIYTSGTTGAPKGVMLSHGNITSNVMASLTVLPLRNDDECLSFLPLSHIFERMAGHYLMLRGGAIINYATSIETVPAELMERRPSFVLAVPRLYEKIYARALEAASSSRVKRSIFGWARRIGDAWVDLTLAGRPVPATLAARQAIARTLVFRKVKARVGGRVRCFVSGGAPLSADVARFFYSAGLPILEGYGLTETSPVIAVNKPGRTRLGTVGPVLPGVEVKIAEDGEILTRGPHVMQGYYNNPEATAEAIDPEGWFHTGDIGLVDSDGYLKITDRKKDLIVTAGGKNIAPQPIEALAKKSRFVASAVMLGDKRRFPILLVVPNLEHLRTWAAHKSLTAPDTEALLALPQVKEKMDREVKATLRDLAQFEMPKKLLLLGRDFSIESGELTPKMSVKRHVVEKNYARQIEALYADSATPVPDPV